MRILLTASILVFASAAALPSSACDRHGGGMFGQFGGASWTDYNPATAESDAAFLDEQLNEWHKKNAVPQEAIKPAKPTFSSASNRASIAAQARIARKAKLMQGGKVKSTSTAKPSKSALR